MTYHAGAGVFVRRATVEDAQTLAGVMSEADRNEIWAVSHHTPLMALAAGYDLSKPAYTIEWKGRPVAMLGVVPAIHGIGAVWMLSSDDIKKIRMVFLRRIARRYLAKFLEHYDRLINFVYADNETAVALLRWLGAQFEDPAPFGLDQKPFMRFEFRRELCADRHCQ